jgi:hypothetical protein
MKKEKKIVHASNIFNMSYVYYAVIAKKGKQMILKHLQYYLEDFTLPCPTPAVPGQNMEIQIYLAI